MKKHTVSRLLVVFMIILLTAVTLWVIFNPIPQAEPPILKASPAPDREKAYRNNSEKNGAPACSQPVKKSVEKDLLCEDEGEKN